MVVEGKRHQESQCARGSKVYKPGGLRCLNWEGNGTNYCFSQYNSATGTFCGTPIALGTVKPKPHSVVESGLFLGYRSGPFLGNLDRILCGAVNLKSSELKELRISQRRPVTWRIGRLIDATLEGPSYDFFSR